MSISAESLTLGLDLGSSYVKTVLVDDQGRVVNRGCCRTGYDYQLGITSLIDQLPGKPAATGVTGYGRYDWDGDIQKTEISCMARAARELGITAGFIVDIGGQDCKVVELAEGKVQKHSLNRRCAAGTGSYLEYLSFRLEISHEEMDRLAGMTEDFHELNSFCTVFSSTEILDCMRNKVPLEKLIRGMYASIVARTREMSTLAEPLYLSGGVIEHHPVLTDVFSQVLKLKAQPLDNPQHLAAFGAAIYAREALNAGTL